MNRQNEYFKDLWDKADDFAPAADILSSDKMLSTVKAIDSRIDEAVCAYRTRKKIGMIASIAVCVGILVLSFASKTDKVILSSSQSNRASFVLPDGSHIWLNNGSTLSYKDGLKGRTRTVYLQGEGYFDVARDESHPFVVKTRDLKIRALGTRFSVASFADEHEVTWLESGSVSVSSDTFKDVVLRPSQALEYDRTTGRCTISSVNVSNHTSWTLEKLEFNNMVLPDIVSNLQHWYNVKIVLPVDHSLDGVRLSMKVRREPIEEILDAMSAIASINYFTDGKTVYLNN